MRTTKNDLVRFDVPYGENAFAILGGFKRAALRDGFSNEWIKYVMTEAMSGDYDHLLEVIEGNCK